MGIFYQKEDKVFTLQTKNSTYQMKVDEYGYLLHLYYGRKTKGVMDYLLSYSDRGFSGNPYHIGKRRDYSLDYLPQEYPSYGTGDYRNTALIVKNEDGSTACDLRYLGYKILQGKYALKGLPAVYASLEEAQTLEIYLEDSVSGVRVDLLYGVLPELDIITRAERIYQTKQSEIILEKAQTACLDFVAGDFDIISFYGAHTAERNYQRMPVSHGTYTIGSRRGMSSHQYNPMMILADHEVTEGSGSCYAMSFVYSGNFKGEVEKDQTNGTRMLMGLMDELFSYPLAKDQIFYTPEVIMTYSAEGLAKLSQNLQMCIRKHICRGMYKEGIRPVLLNSWEAFYFNFDGEKIYQLAVDAKDLGIDMIVLDDGWFGLRDSDFTGLGDWVVNEEKLGEPLSNLLKRVNDLGVKFGIWFEPECINEESNLYKAHPDWVIKIPGRDPIRSRYQLILDYSRKEVVDYIFDAMCKILDQGKIAYVKWDFNRSIYDVFSNDTSCQGKVLYDYILGLYDFLERLVTRYPHLLLEGCSGGGGRFDAGMLYYAPQIWCSDNTDALDRLRIQYGTSFGYPVSAVGSHVSAVPNHQTGRMTPIHTRNVVAMSGTFGYELDPSLMSEEDKEEVREQVKLYKKYRNLIHNGRYYRLTNPFTNEICAWMMVSEDQGEALLNVVCQNVHSMLLTSYVKLMGLQSGEMYKDEKSGKIYPADALMESGYPIPGEIGDYNAYQIHLVKML